MSDSASILGAALSHDSATKHTTGEALYIDDIPEPRGTLHLVPGYANAVCGQLRKVDLSAVESAPNVVAVLRADDVPGTLDISPTHAGDDPLLAKDRIRFFGEPIFAVVARGYQDARRASRLALSLIHI